MTRAQQFDVPSPSIVFTHRHFETYDLAQLPCDCDVYLIDERYVEAWERELVATFEGHPSGETVGEVSFAAVRQSDSSHAELIRLPVDPRALFGAC